MNTKKIDQLLSNGALVSVEKSLGGIFDTLPGLPKWLVDFIVMIVPYAMLVGGVGSIISGFSGSSWKYQWWMRGNLGWMFESLFLILVGALMIVSFTSLRERLISGWRIMFWVAMLNILDLVAWFSFGSLLGLVINLYILFQLKPRYQGSVVKMVVKSKSKSAAKKKVKK